MCLKFDCLWVRAVRMHHQHRCISALFSTKGRHLRPPILHSGNAETVFNNYPVTWMRRWVVITFSEKGLSCRGGRNPAPAWQRLCLCVLASRHLLEGEEKKSKQYSRSLECCLSLLPAVLLLIYAALMASLRPWLNTFDVTWWSDFRRL